MTIIGLGTDILEIARIRLAYERHGDHFLKKILSLREQAYCLKHKDPIPRIAGRFCAKEAIAKALGTGFGEALSFLDIEIINGEQGKPYVVCSPLLQEKYGSLQFLLSLSHCDTFVTATAILIQTPIKT